MGWGESICVSGPDLKVLFYDMKGNVLQKFDYSNEDKEKEYTIAAFSPTGQSVVLGGFNRFRTFSYSSRRKQWEEAPVTDVKNFYSVTALAWKKDGSRLAVGSLCGAVDLYDACLRRFKYKGKFEMIYTSPSQVIVKKLATG
jgi:intraflagellar transport protein 172